VDARVGHQVGLKLSDVDVQGTVKPQGGGQGGDDLQESSLLVYRRIIKVEACSIIHSWKLTTNLSAPSADIDQVNY
jgi:hypothetical protein